MLNKLIKYDLKYMTKNMLPFYILTIVFAILARVLSLFNQTFIVTLIMKIFIGTSISLACSTLFNTLIRSWVRFNENVYGDESYLTHTLPVSKKSIYESKFLFAIIFTLIGFLVILVSLFIMFYSKERLNDLITLFKNISTGINYNVWYLVIMICLILFLEIFNVLQSGYLGIIFGNKSKNRSGWKSFLFGCVVYVVTQNIILILLLIYGLINGNVLELFTSNNAPSINLINEIMIYSTICYTFIIILVNVVSVKVLNKGVNIE